MQQWRGAFLWQKPQKVVSLGLCAPGKSLMGQSQVKTSCSPTLYGVSDSLVPESAVYLGKVTQVQWGGKVVCLWLNSFKHPWGLSVRDCFHGTMTNCVCHRGEKYSFILLVVLFAFEWYMPGNFRMEHRGQRKENCQLLRAWKLYHTIHF